MADIWVNSTLSLAGTSLPSLVTTPNMNPAYREIILANGSANALFGYAPGAGNAGFSFRTMAFSANAATVLNALLNTAGVAIAQQLGSVGGASLATCFTTDLEVAGSENGDIEISGTAAAKTPPTPGGTVAAASGYGQPLHFNDVASVKLPGGTVAVKLTTFRFKITRRLAEYRGNTATGLPQDLKVVVTTVDLDATYQKLNDVETTAAKTKPRVILDCPLIITQVDAASPVTLTLTCQSAFHSAWPSPVGNTTDYISESAMLRSDTGSFSVT